MLQSVKISELPSADTLTEDDLIVVDQPDDTKKATLFQVFSHLEDTVEQSVLVELAQPTGASKIGLSQGGNLQQSVLYFTPDQDGAIGDGVNDDSDHVQNIFNKAAAAAIASPSGIFIPQTVKINRTYRVTKTLTIDGSKVRVESDAGGCLYFDPAGTYTDNRGIVVTNNANLAAFIGNAKPLFSGIAFLTTGNTLDLFYAVRGDAVSSNNGACVFSEGLTDFLPTALAAGDGYGWHALLQILNSGSILPVRLIHTSGTVSLAVNGVPAARLYISTTRMGRFIGKPGRLITAQVSQLWFLGISRCLGITNLREEHHP